MAQVVQVRMSGKALSQVSGFGLRTGEAMGLKAEPFAMLSSAGRCCPSHTLMPTVTAQRALNGHKGSRGRLDVSCCVAVEEDAPPAAPVVHRGIVDYYELLGVDDDATQSEIKSAYRNLAKECHPDYLGNEGHNICILLNEAYEILSMPETRKTYNEQLQSALIDVMDDFTGAPYSKWLIGHRLGKNDNVHEERGVFVDECECIGCKQCVWLASGVFRIEPEYGRSRVFAQWANSEDEIQASIDSCPVDCISWVHRDQLPALEYVTRFRTKRQDVASMMSGMGGGSSDVFAAADRFLKARQRRETERKRAVKRSEQQERTRRQAAFSLMRKRGGWMADFSSYMESAFNGVMRSVDSSMDEDIEAPKVGFRKRRTPGAPIDKETGATIPVERSLVRRG